MARHKHGNRIGAASPTNRANRLRITNCLRHLRVTPRPAPGDLAQGLPYALLKLCAAGQVNWWRRFQWTACQRKPEGLAGGRVPLEDLGCRPGCDSFLASLLHARWKLQSAQALTRIACGEFPVWSRDR